MAFYAPGPRISALARGSAAERSGIERGTISSSTGRAQAVPSQLWPGPMDAKMVNAAFASIGISAGKAMT